MRVGYSHLGSPMPSRRLSRAGHSCPASVARVGVEPTDDHQGLSLAALPVCVPCHESNLQEPMHESKFQEPNSKNQRELGIWFLKFGSSGPLRSVPDGI